MQIAVYRAERDAGLEQAVRSRTSVALASVARTVERGELSKQAMARLRVHAAQLARADVNDFDLHHLTTVMVSVGWNKDDVFDRVETWTAHHTPEDKQLNHDSKIVGHIISNRVVGADGKDIADDAAVDDVPPSFHIVTGAVLYKHWQTPVLQQQMDDILSQIAKGKLHVSMECLFGGFDYCLQDTAGGTRVVARNTTTAFLTKHLKAYGGTGQYGGERVGRLLRNIVFSGKGLVKNPANPESVILSSTPQPSSTSAALLGGEPPLSGVQRHIARCFGLTE